MRTSQDTRFFVSSVPYNVVRCRQLEGTYPGDAQTGCWPVTSLRVLRGWGDIPQEAWPNSALQSWPPPEPPGLDEIARENRIFRYQRIRTAQECWDAVCTRHPVMASFEITRQWFDAAGGIIPIPEENTPILGSHMVTIVGADQSFMLMPGGEKRFFLFENWWGRDWGVNGHGFLPWEFFNRWMVEAWTVDVLSPEKTKQNESYWTVPGIISGVQYVGEINDPNKDERLAWTIVTPRPDSLDVEELFVVPKCRRNGYGTKLSASLDDLSRSLKLPLRFLVPFSDCESENLAVVRRILERIGYRVEVSGLRWAPYFGTLSSGPDVRPYFPQKPALARPQPASEDAVQRQARERAGVFDSDFQEAAESVFNQHEELLRRLA